jgi:hypothetical protein
MSLENDRQNSAGTDFGVTRRGRTVRGLNPQDGGPPQRQDPEILFTVSKRRFSGTC